MDLLHDNCTNPRSNCSFLQLRDRSCAAASGQSGVSREDGLTCGGHVSGSGRV